jgi:transmembrane sensor
VSNVVRLKPSAGPPDALREEACQWVVRLESGLSTADQATLQAWLDRSPAHLRAFLDAAQVWDEASVLSELSEVFPLASYLPPKRQRQRMRIVGLSLAAAALLVCCLMPALYRLLPLGAVDHTPASPTLHYATRIGEHHTVLLPDGSSVVLNTNSQIDVQFTADSRDVHLRRGEAHFDVAKDSSRPFRVYANGGVVEAVGTAFTVQESGAEGLEVTVVEGVVNVTPLLLPPSEPAAKHEGEESLTQS